MEAIYAIDISNGLSKNCNIPWKSKKDLTFFMNKTKNNVVIMGKNTYFSLPKENRPLKNRLNIVLTNNPELYFDELSTNEITDVLFTSDRNIYVSILNDREKYLSKYKVLHENFKIFFIGGKTIYEQFIPLCEKVWVTKIKNNYDCDLFFHYDYSEKFNENIYYEDEELIITVYSKTNY